MFISSYLNFVSQIGIDNMSGEAEQSNISAFHKFFSKLSSKIIEEETLFQNFVKIFNERLIKSLDYFVNNSSGNLNSFSNEIQNLSLYPKEIYLNVLMKVIIKYGETFKKI